MFTIFVEDILTLKSVNVWDRAFLEFARIPVVVKPRTWIRVGVLFVKIKFCPFLFRQLSKQKEGALELLNQRDCSGCTPMHYATQQGNIKSVQGLIDLGATVNLKNKEKQSPLHFAARYCMT